MTPQGLLDILGIDYTERPNRLSFCCPFHPDSDPSAGFYLDTGLAHCFSCGYTMDTTAFYAKFRGIRRDRAGQELAREAGEEYEPEAEPQRDTADARKRRVRGEAGLYVLRTTGTDRKTFCRMGELLDKIVRAAEQGLLPKDTLDRAEANWHRRLWELMPTSMKESPKGTDPLMHPELT